MKALEMLMTICVGVGSAPPPKSLNMFSKTGMTFHKQHDHDEHRDDQDRDRVDHRALDLALQLHRLLDVEREPVKDRVEDAADLAGRDQVDVEVVERPWGACERVGEGRALLDLRLHVGEHLLEGLVRRLRREDVEALHERQAGVDHRRELAGEDDEVLLGDARPSRTAA